MKRIHLTEEKLNTLLNNTRKNNIVMNVLIGCEESQAVCKAFRNLGHNAYSCDLQKCSGDHPEWHFNCDIFKVIDEKGGVTQAGTEVHVPKWNLLIAHPPCTFLAVSGAQWFYNPEDKDLPVDQRRPHPLYPNRAQDREEGAEFFMKLANADVDRIAIENPIGIMSKRWRKPDQIIQPWQFGDPAKKKTCLWLKNLPLLEPEYFEEPEGLDIEFGSGKKNPKWYFEALSQAATEANEWAKETNLDRSTPEGKKAYKDYLDAARRRIRSKTFGNIARKMAETWGNLSDDDQF